jgi:hypothetical protein
MSFSSDLTSCMSPLPAPTVEGVEDFVEWIHQVHNAWESSGGESETLLAGLVAAGAVTGIDEAALAAAGAATVMAYLAVATGCMVSVLAGSVWDVITAPVTPVWLQSQLMAQAQARGVAQPEAMA